MNVYNIMYHDEHGSSWHDRVKSWHLGQDGVARLGVVFKHLHGLGKEGLGNSLEDGSLNDG